MTSPVESTERATKRRAPMSCDRCKSRKTKCVDPIPGPCQFCASIGARCHLDPSRRRQRPYYHVSEEEFRYMTKALEHFLPNIDLNLHSLKEVVRSINIGPPETGGGGLTLSEAGDAVHIKTGSSSTSGGGGGGGGGGGPDSASSVAGTAVTIEDIDDLHGELGWLRVDSRGTYRHVGADSGYGFNAAVRSLKTRRASEASKSDLVAPITAAPPLPPTTPESSIGIVGSTHQIFLPRRDLCNRCVSRFFAEIQSIYWFFSAERFYSALDRIYAGDAAEASPSMLCCLYSILALTCESESGVEPFDPASPPAIKYLSLAKGLVPTLYDEADVDSMRALSLLGLALQSSMFSNTAYIYLGSAARIAFTLGLHLQKTPESRSCLQRQVDLRLFSTLFLLDQDIALCYGNPSAISEDNTNSHLQDLSEQILSPGSNMPLDYLAVSCKLAQLKRRISRLLYSKTSSAARNAPISSVSDHLTSLRAWYASIPPHLRDAAQAALYHQRSVAVLHLRYWSATVFATRPFLLYSILHPERLSEGSAKKAWFDDFSAVCVEAATASLRLIVYMRDTGLLSSLVTLDTGCVLEDLQVFLLAVSRGDLGRSDDVRECLATLQAMEQVLWTRHALTEVMAQLEENGMLNGEDRFSPRGETPGHFFLDIAQQHDLVPGVMDAYLPDLQDSFFSIDERPTELMSSGAAELMASAEFRDSCNDGVSM